ncbi:MAG: hypothetical protein QM743_00460 [Chitinophagaceae bacterium]
MLALKAKILEVIAEVVQRLQTMKDMDMLKQQIKDISAHSLRLLVIYAVPWEALSVSQNTSTHREEHQH